MNRIAFRGIIPINALREQLPTYDAGFIPTRQDAMTRYSLSTKLLEYIHLGVPLIVPRLPTYLMYFPESTAWYFQPNDPASAAQAISVFAAAAPQERVRRSLDAQEAAKDIGWDRDGPRLRQLYERLLHRRDHPT
jgi:glycosyltransferase involved in cell wall biosynthesis